ncbi:alpha-N-acetylglucosaminidase N-terminal domain-containing protein [Streptomyces sp. NPDC001312]|uniref:alpha-N-acetylglucosaminidase N-terminal domain-containing protein n=1 Tax=Streptomyces sp. NPDC001312 TaxID=3364561 RepID=UPI00367E1B9C
MLNLGQQFRQSTAKFQGASRDRQTDHHRRQCRSSSRSRLGICSPRFGKADRHPGESERPGEVALGPARSALLRLVGPHSPHIADQIHFQGVPASDGKFLRIEGSKRGKQRINVFGTSPAVLLTGFNWYLKHVALGSISWDSEQLDLPAVLPAPSQPIEQRASVAHRLFGNDIWTDYAGPHRGWREWERELDPPSRGGG